MRALIQRVVLWLFLIGLGTAAHAEWLEASNKHFIVYGDIPKQRLAAFTDKLERYGAAVRRLFQLPEPEGGIANRVTIYVVSDPSAVQRYLSGDRSTVAGFYRTSAAGSLIVTPLTTDNDDPYFTPNLVLFHEYAHHLLLGNSAALYPGWVSEGLAELLATAIVKPDGSVTFGAANNARAESILDDNPMTVKKLLDTDGRELDGDQTEQLYARGWLVAHYLLLGGSRPGQFGTYLKLIAQGMSSAKAGEEAFGDLRRLNADLNSYRQKRLSGVRIAADKITPDPVTVRQLSAADAAIMPLRFQSAIGVRDAAAKKLVAPARNIAAANPGSAWIERTLAEIEYDAGNLDAADAAADRALALDPGNLGATTYKALVRIRRAEAAQPADPARWRDARAWIVKANRIAPDYALPLLLFYDSFVKAGEAPRPSATDGVLRAVELAPQDNALRVRAFGVLLEKGDLAAARRALAPVAFNPHAGADNPARAVLAQMDSGADLATVHAAAVQAKLFGSSDGE